MTTPAVLVPVADGTEELEAVAIIDILRRSGADVTVASVSPSLEVTCSKGVRLRADCTIQDCVNRDWTLVVLPGGIPGVENLRDSQDLIQILKRQDQTGQLFGAICAAPPVVLQPHGLLDNRLATCHPGFAAQLRNRDKTRSDVIVDGNCTTSRGAGTAVAFALTLVERLYNQEKRKDVEAGLAMVDRG
ncbi:MAG: DJ-1 family glyoxalase III [Pseudomonadota bacterium]